MSGLRRFYGDTGGFSITDFTDHYDVRILPQQRAQYAVKIETAPWLYLCLVNPL